MTAVVIVSGWAMSAEILSPLVKSVEILGNNLKNKITTISLADAEGESWNDLFALLDATIGEDSSVVLVGWSLGGNLCARFAAEFPEKIQGLVTMGSTPCFVGAEGWSAGKHPAAYQEFADGVAADIHAAMKGFAPVCARGSLDLKASIRAFRASAKWALNTDTDWRELLNRLAEDARSQWQKVNCPAHHFLAESDPLAKVEMSADLQALLPQHKVSVVSGSHGIFLDHTDEVAQAINTLCMEAR